MANCSTCASCEIAACMIHLSYCTLSSLHVSTVELAALAIGPHASRSVRERRTRGTAAARQQEARARRIDPAGPAAAGAAAAWRAAAAAAAEEGPS